MLRRPFIPTNKPMMPGMNMDLMNALNRRKKKAEGEEEAESTSSKPPSETSPPAGIVDLEIDWNLYSTGKSFRLLQYTCTYVCN